MDNTGPNKLPRPLQPADDIPIAQRETPNPVPKPRFNRFVLIAGVMGAAAVALVAGVVLSLRLQSSQDAAQAPGTSTNSIDPSSSPTASPSASPAGILGHLPYSEAPKSELEPIVSDGSIKLRKAAARAYREMEAAAQQEGVILVPISGFRSTGDQEHLFFDVKAERGQVAAERAKVSAPPGYSEHHTGYAIDIGDGNVSATNLSPSFDSTAAFRWLQDNAPRYSFELSFPKGNKQGVSYEPWHWRYTGDMDSLKTFYRARSPKP